MIQETLNQTITPKRNLPRDVFLHIFSMVALYWVAVSFITLCWQYINYFFPDVLSLRYNYQSYVWPIRFAVASLVITFPLFLLASWFLNKIYRRETVVRESRIRKWLIYLTLFIASLIIVGDLVSVIFNFLGGDVTVRFVLKALSVLIVAGVVFGYYLDDVRRPEPSKSARYYAISSGIVILVMIVGAFFIIGSPHQARIAQLDQQRVSDLQNIQYQVVNYWQRKGALPKSLADLTDSISGYVAPVDPETNQSYEYALKDAASLAFELCATFGQSSNQTTPEAFPKYPMGDVFSQSWDHGAGRVCFERKIDKQLYPFDKGVQIRP